MVREEKQRVDLHREELLTQTEHLQELNIELERLSLVASKTDSAVMIADKQGRFTWVNQGFVKLFGYSMSELTNRVGDNIFDVSTELNIRPMVKHALETKQSLNYTSKILTKSGETKWVKTTLNPIFDENGDIKQYIIIDTDVSELKLINEKLKKLSLVASKTDNSVIIFNNNNEIDWVNEGFHKMYGYSKNEFIERFGKSVLDFFKMNSQEDLYKKLNDLNESFTYVSTFHDRFSIIKWKQTTFTPIIGDISGQKNYIVVENDITRIKEIEQKIQEEKDKSDKLLLNILPEETAEELKTKGKATPRFYRSVSVLFADIQDFTKLAETLTPDELVHDLQSYFSRFDDAVSKYFVEKIKTMGDAFLCVGGIPMRNKSHPFDTVFVGLELQRIIQELGKEREESGRRAWNLRIGIHTGPVVAGVVGKQKMTYDIWGDTVNISKRIESACLPGMVNISSSTYEIIKDYFECEHRGKVLAKHKGHIDMYFVHRIKPEFSINSDGITPNNYFKEMMAQL
ncbi:MAG: PAS domain S-box protein [Salinivirgaceae bacterium]|nr:PAS domain S-box protein [Salinivirgaceae bacterium]